MVTSKSISGMKTIFVQTVILRLTYIKRYVHTYMHKNTHAHTHTDSVAHTLTLYTINSENNRFGKSDVKRREEAADDISDIFNDPFA